MPVRLTSEMLSLIFSSTNFSTPEDCRTNGKSISLVCRLWSPYGKALIWRKVQLLCKKEDYPPSGSHGCQRAILDYPSLGKYVTDLSIKVDLGCLLYRSLQLKLPEETADDYIERLGFSWLREFLLCCSGIQRIRLREVPAVMIVWVLERLGNSIIEWRVEGGSFNRSTTFRVMVLLAAMPNLTTCFFHGFESNLYEPHYDLPIEIVSPPLLSVTTVNLIAVVLDQAQGGTALVLHGISQLSLRSLSVFWDEIAIRVLKSRPFPNLTTLNIQGGGENFLLFAPQLGPLLLLLPHLENLAIYNGGKQPPISGKVISDVLNSVSPTLIHLRLYLALSRTDSFLVNFWNSNRCPKLQDIVFLDENTFTQGAWFSRELLLVTN